MKKKLTALFLSAAMCASMIPSAALAADMPYTDVKAGDWFYSQVEYVTENKIMTGTSPTTFAPEESLTRAMVATVLYRIEGEPKVTYNDVFKDVPNGEWYSSAISWAYDNKITNGTSKDVFGLDDSITREQFATMLYRYSEFKKYDITGKDDLSKYTDKDDVSDWALNAMKWSVKNKIITGIDDTLVPGSSAIRSQCATILQRFCTAFVKETPEEPETAQYAAYAAVLKGIVADTTKYATETGKDIKNTEYALLNLNGTKGDGVEAMLVMFKDAAAADDKVIGVWTFDAETGKTVEAATLPLNSTFYDNGYIKYETPAEDAKEGDFVPYEVVQFNSKTNKFDKVASAYAKADEADKDKINYFFVLEGTKEEDIKALTKAEFDTLANTYVSEGKLLTVTGKAMSDENIAALEAKTVVKPGSDKDKEEGTSSENESSTSEPSTEE